MTWKAVARSSIGTSHQELQMPCQDYGEYRLLNDVMVGAVADGAGSAKYADVGARLAVKRVLAYFAGIEQWLQKQKYLCPSSPQPLSEERARGFFARSVTKVLSALQKQAVSSDYSVEDLACTLLVFIATPHWLTAMQIGDGFLVVRPQDSEHQLLFHPDKGEFANETTFVTSANALDEMQVKVLSGQQKFICASTDGLEKVAIRMSNWAPFALFFKPLEEYLWETSNPEQEDEYLMSFLDSERLNSRTDDDKTLLLCLYNRE